MAGLRRGQGGFDRFVVAHFAHQDDVRILAQGTFQRDIETFGVKPHFTLIDNTALVAMQIFDGVLDGDDMAGAGAVDVVDHCCQGGRFPRTGGAGDQHQTALLLADLLEHAGQLQLIEVLHLEGDDTEHHGNGAALPEYVDAKAAQPRHSIGQVDLVHLFEVGLLRGVHDPVRHLGDLLGDHARRVGQRLEGAVDAVDGGQSCLDVNVRGACP